MLKYLPLITIMAVACLPIFGWESIPKFYDYNPASAMTIGLVCGVLIAISVWISVTYAR